MDESASSNPRKRIRLACEECRKNKRKCQGQKPACALCTKAGKVCNYIPLSTRSTSEISSEYVHSLEHEVAALKTIIAEYNGGRDKLPEEDDDPIETMFPHHGIIKINKKAKNHPSGFPMNLESPENLRSQGAMDDLASLMLTVNLEDHGEPSFTISTAKSKTPTNPNDKLQTKGAVRNTGAQISAGDELELKNHLLNCFLQDFDHLHHFLDSKETLAFSTRVLADEPLDIQLRDYAILSVGAHFSLRSDMVLVGSTYSTLAEGMVTACLRDYPSDLTVQGICLLAWRELMLGNDSMAYCYISMATGLILYLGLHVCRVPRSEEGGLWQPGYLRRVRSFWAYFSIDRIINSNLGMNCTMHWQRIRTPAFLTIIDREPTLNEVAHDAFCRLWHLWDSCLDQVYAFEWDALPSSERGALLLRSRQRLAKFYGEIDKRLQLQGGHMPESAVCFQLAYHAALLLIHRPFLNDPSQGSVAIQSVTGAAVHISRIVRQYRQRQEFVGVTPQVLYYTMSAAVIHLLNATCGRTSLGRQSANGLKNCLEAMLGMRSKWQIRTQRSIELIQELAHKWKVVWALPISLSQPISVPIEPQNIPATPPQQALTGAWQGAPVPTLSSGAVEEMFDQDIWDQNAWNFDGFTQLPDALNDIVELDWADHLQPPGGFEAGFFGLEGI